MIAWHTHMLTLFCNVIQLLYIHTDILVDGEVKYCFVQIWIKKGCPDHNAVIPESTVWEHMWSIEVSIISLQIITCTIHANTYVQIRAIILYVVWNVCMVLLIIQWIPLNYLIIFCTCDSLLMTQSRCIFIDLVRSVSQQNTRKREPTMLRITPIDHIPFLLALMGSRRVYWSGWFYIP